MEGYAPLRRAGHSLRLPWRFTGSFGCPAWPRLLCLSGRHEFVALEDERLDLAPALYLRCIEDDAASIAGVGFEARVAFHKRGRVVRLEPEGNLAEAVLLAASRE